MNQRITGYVVAGVAVLLVLVLVGRYALRETPKPATTNTEPREAEPQRRDQPVSPAPEFPAEALVSQPQDSTPTNAAMLYDQAFALYDALSKEEKWLTSDWRTNVDASVEAEVCEKIRPICNLMHQAVNVTNCDWGLERPFSNEIFKRLTPVFMGSRGIARTAIWAAAHCRENDQSQIIKDLAATSKLGHDMPPVLIGCLVDVAIQGMMQDFVAKHATTLARSNDPRLPQLFEGIQFDEPLFRALESEADFSQEPLPEMSDEARSVWVAMFPKAQSMTLDQINDSIRQFHEWQAQYVEALQLPEAEYRQWLTQLHAAEKLDPLLEELMSSIEAAVDRIRRAKITTAILAAGLAVVRDGRDALQTHPDPATGQSFIYTETTDGFELQSTYAMTNVLPIKMQFK